MKNKVKFQLSASFVILIIVCALFAQYICPYDPYEQDLSIAYQAPSMAHLMGTDAYGRDMFSRVIMGGQVSVLSTLALVAIISIFGTAVGVIC